MPVRLPPHVRACLALCEAVGLAPEVFGAQNLLCALTEDFGPRMAADPGARAASWRKAHEAVCQRLGIITSLDPPPTTENQ